MRPSVEGAALALELFGSGELVGSSFTSSFFGGVESDDPLLSAAASDGEGL